MDRRLSTILAADIVGYSRMMGADEESTLRKLDELRKIVDQRVHTVGGRIFSLAGDGLLADFASPVSAVRAGYEIQRDLDQRNRDGLEPIQLRIGVHLADVVVRGDDLLGDGVNIAARIEAVAAPGSVTISRSVFDQVKRTANLIFEDLGEHTLKNISEPIRLYKVAGEKGIHCYAAAAPEGSAIQNAASLTSIDKPSIAVLPFSNMSGDADQDYFADGFSEDLMTELGRFKALFVASRSASAAYRGRAVDARRVGIELGVKYCLEGSVRKLGQRIRISAQLIDASNGEQIWADRFDRNIDALFDLQDELVSEIVGTIADRVEDTAAASARRKRPADMDAHDCLLRGLEHHRLGGVTFEDADKALKWFDRAIEMDPEYGRAHAWRACAIANRGEIWTDNMDWWDQCISSAERALDLDSNEAEVHRILGSIHLVMRNFDKAEHHFNRGMEINPNHAYIIAKTAEFYSFSGDGEKALELLERALRLDPFLPDYCRQDFVLAHYVLENYSLAVTECAKMARLTRRAAAYCAASSIHCDGEDPTEFRQALLRIDPDFRIRPFLQDQPFKDRKRRDRLSADLRAAGLPE